MKGENWDVRWTCEDLQAAQYMDNGVCCEKHRAVATRAKRTIDFFMESVLKRADGQLTVGWVSRTVQEGFRGVEINRSWLPVNGWYDG